MRSVCCGVAWFSMVLAIAGCGGGDTKGPDLAEAKGVVTYKGKPLEGAVVQFLVEDAPIATGTTNEKGEFVMTTGGRKGAPIGTAKVTVTKEAASYSSSANTNMTPDQMRKMQMERGMGKATATPKDLIPRKYADPATSGLTAEVSEDASKNEFTFPLN